MSSIHTERGGERRMSGLPVDADRRQPFTRRIECDGTRGPAHGAPARGGGLREPDAWTRRRDDHR